MGIFLRYCNLVPKLNIEECYFSFAAGRSICRCMCCVRRDVADKGGQNDDTQADR